MSKARDLANIISGSGTLNANVIPNLAASKITSGTLGADRIPDLATSKITSGTFADARISASSVNAHVDLTSLSASNLTSGTVPSARLSLAESDVPNLSAAKITSGTMDGSRISGGTFGAVNGSALTSLPSSAPSTSQVTSAMAGASVGATGTFAFLAYTANRGQAYTQGTTLSGSDLKYANPFTNGSSVSGTWRLMGFIQYTASGEEYKRASCFLRIS